VAASSPAVRRRAPARNRIWTRIAVGAAALALVALIVPLFFAGSADRLADGTRIAGIDVGGLSPSDATTLLQQRADRLSRVPVTFVAGTSRFEITPRALGVHVDWRAAVATAARAGSGLGVVRGYRRLELQLFPQDLVPSIRAYDAALDYELTLLAKRVDTRHREAQLVRRGLHITIAPGSTGRFLDRAAARQLLVRSLASFSRAPVGLPVRIDEPQITVATLTAKQRRASRIISAPVTLVAGETRWRMPRWRLATLLDLDTLRFSGTSADRYFTQLEGNVERPPKDATFAVANGAVRVVPSEPGLTLDVPRSAAAVLAAAERSLNRVATLVLEDQQPKRTTAQAQAMGITGTVGSYETVYGGEANRIHNVQLVAHLVDNKLIAPGATFSFNGTTGERSAEKGFLEAPVIVNGELQTGLGGGVCQVSTTVFNAAYEAGLRITARTNHSLYISHYPLGRDATVNYPDTDLKFVNDTPHWLLLRTWVGPTSLTVGLYGTPQHRRIDTIAAPLRVVAAPPVQKTVDATLKRGEVAVDDYGVPAQSTQVERKVYAPSGALLSDQTWYSSYRSEPKIVRVGPKKKAPKPAKSAQAKPATPPATPH
jgi:vancomycin resistance protein YoaR